KITVELGSLPQVLVYVAWCRAAAIAPHGFALVVTQRNGIRHESPVEGVKPAACYFPMIVVVEIDQIAHMQRNRYIKRIFMSNTPIDLAFEHLGFGSDFPLRIGNTGMVNCWASALAAVTSSSQAAVINIFKTGISYRLVY